MRAACCLVLVACGPTTQQVQLKYTDVVMMARNSPARAGDAPAKDSVVLLLASGRAELTISDTVYRGTAELTGDRLSVDARDDAGTTVTMACTRAPQHGHPAGVRPSIRCDDQAAHNSSVAWGDPGAAVDAWTCAPPRFSTEASSWLGGGPVFAPRAIEHVRISCCVGDACQPAGDGLRYVPEN